MGVAVGAHSVLTPQQANFGTLKKHVAGYVQGASLPSFLADAGAALNAAVDKINTRVWHWMNRQETLTLVADTRTVTVAANFKKPRNLEKLDTNSKTVGLYAFQPPKDFQDSFWEDTASGQPEFYTIRNAADDRLLTFNIPPSTAFVASWPTARFTYFARMGHFSDNGDTLADLEVPPELRNFLVWYARWELATIRGGAHQIAAARDAWVQEWRSLVADDTNEQTDWIAKGRYA